MKKDNTSYYIAYERDRESGGYIASAPALPGCVVYGKTLRGAYRNIRQAIQECVDVLHAFRQTPPQETIQPETVRKFSFVMPTPYAKTETPRIR